MASGGLCLGVILLRSCSALVAFAPAHHVCFTCAQSLPLVWHVAPANRLAQDHASSLGGSWCRGRVRHLPQASHATHDWKSPCSLRLTVAPQWQVAVLSRPVPRLCHSPHYARGGVGRGGHGCAWEAGGESGRRGRGGGGGRGRGPGFRARELRQQSGRQGFRL